jgi:hypothetical protein
MATPSESESARAKRLDDIETNRDILREEIAQGWRRNLLVIGAVLALVAIVWALR